MSVTWTPRLQVVNTQSEILGWTHLVKVETPVLPRVGEIVAFHQAFVTDTMHLQSAVSFAPKTVQVEHIIGEGNTADDVDITVTIRVTTYLTETELQQLATEHHCNWLPHR